MSGTFNPIKITQKALEQIKKIRSVKKIPEEYGLRVGMQGGGCGGMSFVLAFDTRRETDRMFEIGSENVSAKSIRN